MAITKIFGAFCRIMEKEGKYGEPFSPRHMAVIVDTAVDHAPGITGSFNPKGIRLFLFNMVRHMAVKKQDWRDPEVLGRRAVETLAHEWRHLQQSMDWDMPQVLRKAVSYDGSADGLQEYLEDPGEKDAREFSQLVLREIDPIWFRKIGRILRFLAAVEIRKAKAGKPA